MPKLESLELVLALTDPEYPAGLDSKSVISGNPGILKAALRIAERNGLGYAFRERLKELGRTLAGQDELDRQNSRAILEVQNSINLLNAINRDTKIDYVMIQNYNPVPHLSRDLDIFVREEDKNKIATALVGKGMNYDQSCPADTSLFKEGYQEIDLYVDICYFTKRFISPDFIWDMITEDTMFGVKYPALRPEADFLLWLVHSMYEHRAMLLLDFIHMKNLKAIIHADICRKQAAENGWGKVFDMYVEKLTALEQQIFTKRKYIDFPYIYDAGFILQSVKQIEKLNFTTRQKTGFYVSLWLDKLRSSQRESRLYNMLKSWEFARKNINRVLSIFKVMRGDKMA